MLLPVPSPNMPLMTDPHTVGNKHRSDERPKYQTHQVDNAHATRCNIQVMLHVHRFIPLYNVRSIIMHNHTCSLHSSLDLGGNQNPHVKLLIIVA